MGFCFRYVGKPFWKALKRFTPTLDNFFKALGNIGKVVFKKPKRATGQSDSRQSDSGQSDSGQSDRTIRQCGQSDRNSCLGQKGGDNIRKFSLFPIFFFSSLSLSSFING